MRRDAIMLRLAIHALTAAAFASYGEVFDPRDATGRVDHVALLQNGRSGARPNLFMARTGIVALPHGFTAMESHPDSSQTFVPHGEATMVIAVALPGTDGQPDLRTLQAFAGRRQGFSYRAGVWHLPIASLGEAVPVLGFMYEDGTPRDCLWATVEPVTLLG